MSYKYCNFLTFLLQDTLWQFAKSIYSFKLKFCAQILVKNASLIFREKESYISSYYGLDTETHGTQRVQK